MKKYIGQLTGLILALFAGGSYAQAQLPDIYIPPEKIAYLTSKIDSLPYLLASGRVIVSSKNCLLPEHEI
jgi:hypothetical protein